MKRIEYFAFHLNDSNYRKLVFTRHFSYDAAHKAHYIPYSGSHVSDYDTVVLKGRAALEDWAEECLYSIDWKLRIMIHRDWK